MRKNLQQDPATYTKRAQTLVAMGLVKRNGDHFLVGSASLKNKQGEYQVWRNQFGKVCCNCQYFTHMLELTPNFRCEHIMAVKFMLTLPFSPSASTNGHTESKKGDAVDLLADSRTLSPLAAVSNHHQETEEETNMINDYVKSNEMVPDTSLNSDFRAVLKKLRAPIPLTLIKQREGWRSRDGLAHFVDYIEWHTVADMLDQTTPQWSHAVRSITPIGNLVAVTASITIAGITREGIGTGPSDSEMGIKKAEHDALKRAAVKFGIARELYRRDSEGDEPSTEQATTSLQPRDPLAKTLADLITPKQLVAIRAIAHAQGLQAEQECQTIYGCQLEELSRQAASVLIDQLKLRQQPEPQQWQRAV